MKSLNYTKKIHNLNSQKEDKKNKESYSQLNYKLNKYQDINKPRQNHIVKLKNDKLNENVPKSSINFNDINKTLMKSKEKDIRDLKNQGKYIVLTPQKISKHTTQASTPLTNTKNSVYDTVGKVYNELSPYNHPFNDSYSTQLKKGLLSSNIQSSFDSPNKNFNFKKENQDLNLLDKKYKERNLEIKSLHVNSKSNEKAIFSRNNNYKEINVKFLEKSCDKREKNEVINLNISNLTRNVNNHKYEDKSFFEDNDLCFSLKQNNLTHKKFLLTHDSSMNEGNEYPKFGVYAKGSKKLSDYILNNKTIKGTENISREESSIILLPERSNSKETKQIKTHFSISPNAFRTGNSSKIQKKPDIHSKILKEIVKVAKIDLTPVPLRHSNQNSCQPTKLTRDTIAVRRNEYKNKPNKKQITEELILMYITRIQKKWKEIIFRKHKLATRIQSYFRKYILRNKLTQISSLFYLIHIKIKSLEDIKTLKSKQLSFNLIKLFASLNIRKKNVVLNNLILTKIYCTEVFYLKALLIQMNWKRYCSKKLYVSRLMMKNVLLANNFLTHINFKESYQFILCMKHFANSKHSLLKRLLKIYSFNASKKLSTNFYKFKIKMILLDQCYKSLKKLFISKIKSNYFILPFQLLIQRSKRKYTQLSITTDFIFRKIIYLNIIDSLQFYISMKQFSERLFKIMSEKLQLNKVNSWTEIKNTLFTNLKVSLKDSFSFTIVDRCSSSTIRKSNFNNVICTHRQTNYTQSFSILREVNTLNLKQPNYSYIHVSPYTINIIQKKIKEIRHNVFRIIHFESQMKEKLTRNIDLFSKNLESILKKKIFEYIMNDSVIKRLNCKLNELFKKFRSRFIIKNLLEIRTHLRMIDIIISISKRINRNCRKFVWIILRLNYKNLLNKERRNKIMEVVFKGFEINYLNTINKFFPSRKESIQTDETKETVKEKEKGQLNCENDENLNEKHSEKKYRNNYSKNWFENIKQEFNY